MTLILSKLKTLVGKYGLWGLLKKAVFFSSAKLRACLPLSVLLRPGSYLRTVRQILAGDYDRIILWRSGFGFQAALYQRPQQIARQLARQGCLMLYEANPLTDRVKALCWQEDGLLLVNLCSPLLRHVLLRELDRVGKPKYLQIYSTNREMPLRELQTFVRRGWGVLYEYVDHLSPVISGTACLPKTITEKFNYAMQHSSVTVVVTAELLRRDVIKRRGGKNLIISSNGVDCAFYSHWEPYDFEPAFRDILTRGKPIVCYYGALAAWLDYDLIRELAETGKYSVVLFGVKYDASFDRKLRNVEGLNYLGPRDYRVLKYYAREADVLLLPFLVNDITRAASPVKLFEYMALKKPIVSTDIDECRNYRSVLIGKTHTDFLRQIDRALLLGSDEKYLSALDAEAHANDWSEKARAIVDGLKKQEQHPGS